MYKAVDIMTSNPLSEPVVPNKVSSKPIVSKVQQRIVNKPTKDVSIHSDTCSDEEDDEGFSSEDSSKSAILSRFLSRLMEPNQPLYYSKSLPSLIPHQPDNVRFRSEALVTEGWILERCIEGTPGRKYNVSGLIVDSDTILATQMKSGRFGYACGDCFHDREMYDTDDCDESASQEGPYQKRPCFYFYLIVCILIVHLSWCLYRYFTKCVRF